jgi:hypothetical protein
VPVRGDIIVYRAYVTVGIVAALVLLGVVGVIALNNSPQLQLVVYGASATPTVTPSVTPTNTPGLTPTPSMTPQRSPTPSPTVPFEITPGDPIAPPRATAVYPQINAREIAEAFAAIQRGNARAAIPTLSAERQRQVSFDPAPFYYEALAYLALNDQSQRWRRWRTRRAVSTNATPAKQSPCLTAASPRFTGASTKARVRAAVRRRRATRWRWFRTTRRMPSRAIRAWKNLTSCSPKPPLKKGGLTTPSLRSIRAWAYPRCAKMCA